MHGAGSRDASKDAALARRISNVQWTERHRRQHHYDSPGDRPERVRITGLTERRDLNGAFGMAGALIPSTGRRLVVLEGKGGGSVPLRYRSLRRARLHAAPRRGPLHVASTAHSLARLTRARHSARSPARLPRALTCSWMSWHRPSNLHPAPAKPEDAVYNAGKGCYQRRGYSSDGLPRRCRAGEGRLAYSTTKRHEQPPLRPPSAGALLRRVDAPVDYAEAFRDGALPVRLGADACGGLRWLDPLSGVEVPRSAVDARRWLPLLLDGLRDTATPAGAYLALRATIELAGTLIRTGGLPPLMPSAVPALKAALDLRERSCVCAALKVLGLFLRAEPRCGLALRPHYRALLPALAAYAIVERAPCLGDEVEYSQHRQLNVHELIDEALQLMERSGGQGAGALIKSYVPSFQPADVELHRGFR